MSGHPDLRPLLDDHLPGPRRAALVEHLRDCAACRAAVARTDPSRLFALLAAEPVPPEMLDRLSRRVAAAVAAEPRGRARQPSWAWGALAASLLAAALLGAYFWERGSVPTAAPQAPRTVAREVPAPPPDGDMPAGMIEVLDSPGEAEVFELTLGDGVDVVMIYDRRFPL